MCITESKCVEKNCRGKYPRQAVIVSIISEIRVSAGLVSLLAAKEKQNRSAVRAYALTAAFANKIKRKIKKYSLLSVIDFNRSRHASACAGETPLRPLFSQAEKACRNKSGLIVRNKTSPAPAFRAKGDLSATSLTVRHFILSSFSSSRRRAHRKTRSATGFP